MATAFTGSATLSGGINVGKTGYINVICINGSSLLVVTAYTHL